MVTPKRILLLNRSFWPDVEATGQFLGELCEGIAEKYQVVAICGNSYFEDKNLFSFDADNLGKNFESINIIRVWHTRLWKGNLIGRVINWLTYCISAFIVALRQRFDVAIICTDPPFLSLIGAALKWLKDRPFIINCRDLYPDVALALGKMKQGFFCSVFDYINKKSFCMASCVVCLGPSMATRLVQKGLPERKIKVIPDWADTQSIKPILKKDNRFIPRIETRNEFIIMYSGNLGLSQEFELILEALFTVSKEEPIQIVFIGEGVGKKKLKRKINVMGFNNVSFFSYQPKEELAHSLSAADLHLIPLKKGLKGAIVPSKLYGVMAAGRPYIAITDEESEPAIFAKEKACGLLADPDSVESIVAALKWACNNKDELIEIGKRGRALAEKQFDKKIVIQKWLSLLEKFP